MKVPSPKPQAPPKNYGVRHFVRTSPKCEGLLLEIWAFGLLTWFLVLSSLASQNFLLAQTRITLGNTSKGYMVMSGGTAATQIYLVVGDATGNALPNTITQYFAGSGIIADGTSLNNGEFNIIKWYIGNNTSAAGTYTVPWNYDINTPIPVSFSINTAGDANKYFLFSTYRTTWDNSNYLPTSGTNPPTNYYSSAIPGVADAYGVDRFWSVDASDYTTKPDLDNLTFTYVDGGAPNPEIYTTNNAITKTDLQAQRWNSSIATPSWEGSLFGADVGGQNQVQIASLAKADLFKWWTLIDKNKPLPVELLRFSAECNGKNVIINWSTASEQNSAYFTVERSQDGTNFQSVTTAPAAGNSSTVRNYSVVDADPYPGASFYRLYETDMNGKKTFFNPIAITCLPGISIITIYPNPAIDDLEYEISMAESAMVSMKLIDILGRIVMTESYPVKGGTTKKHINISSLSSGAYLLQVSIEGGLHKAQKQFVVK